jgi:hypothetical protein
MVMKTSEQSSQFQALKGWRNIVEIRTPETIRASCSQHKTDELGAENIHPHRLGESRIPHGHQAKAQFRSQDK